MQPLGKPDSDRHQILTIVKVSQEMKISENFSGTKALEKKL
jgi:hypothetical protein